MKASPHQGNPGYFSHLRAILQVGLILFVFAVLPWGLVEAIFLILGETSRARALEHFKIRQEKALSQISLLDDDAFYASRLIRRVFQNLQKAGLNQGRKDLQRLEERFPRCFECVFFNGDGRVLPEVSDLKRGRTFLERCYAVIGAIDRGEKPSSEQTALLRELWKMSRVETLKQYVHGKPMPIGEEPSAGFCCFEFDGKPGNKNASGYLAFFHPEAAPANAALLGTIKAAEKRYPDIQFGAVDFRSGSPVITPPTLDRRTGIRTALLRTISCYDRVYSDENTLMTIIQRKRNGYILALQTLSPPISPGLISFTRLLFFTWSVVLFWQAMTGSFLSQARISGRIIRLFLFSVGIPAALLLLGGYRALEDHKLILLDSLERTMRDKIRQFDERFPLEIARVEDFLQNLRETAARQDNPADWVNVFRKVEKERSITDFLIVDAKGKSSWDLREPENSTVAQRYQIGRLMAREIMKRLNKVDLIDAGTLVSETVNSTMSNLTDAGSWELFQRNLGRFTPFGLSNEGCFMLFDALRGKDGKVERMISAVMFRGQVESRFFRSHRKALERQPELTWRVSLWSRTHLMRSIYTKGIPKQETEEVGKSVHSQLSSIRKIVQTSKGRELLIGQLGQNLQSFVFVARAPLAPLEQQIEQMWRWMALLATLLIIATLVIGRFLSEQLLVPIGNISQGIQAIRDRDFQHEVPVQTHDELGEVSALMNDVIEGMRDLSVARAIQETLFPPDEVTLDSLTIYGRSRTMTDVGGDYFDYVKIDEQHLFGLLGDVSGHGVSAALIMGMAKCFFTVSNRQETSLEEILTGFNQYLFQTIKRKKMMTLVVFRWNATNRTLQFANGGHVSPYLRRAAAGTVEEVAMPCMPLGVRLKATFATRELVLNPGDSVFLCTDGLAEAQNAAGQDVGYGGPPEWLSEAGNRSPKEVVESMFQRLETFRDGATVNDDVTMICLKAL